MGVKIAVVQTDPRLGDVAGNRARMIAAIGATESDLIVFPECALSGYGFSSKDEAWPHAEPAAGESSQALSEACREHGRWVVFGMLERDGDRLFNSAVLVGADGVAGTYRKMHLPFLGVDRFTLQGDLGFPVFTTPVGRLGILICFDLSFPEAARALKLGGAQIICVPTNWPEAASVSCLFAPQVRAQENHVHVVTADRVGEEAGFRFRGGSRICDPDGKVLAEAGWDPETIVATVEPTLADQNRVVIVPGEYEIDRLGQRRPEHYGRLTEAP